MKKKEPGGDTGSPLPTARLVLMVTYIRILVPSSVMAAITSHKPWIRSENSELQS